VCTACARQQIKRSKANIGIPKPDLNMRARCLLVAPHEPQYAGCASSVRDCTADRTNTDDANSHIISRPLELSTIADRPRMLLVMLILHITLACSGWSRLCSSCSCLGDNSILKFTDSSALISVHYTEGEKPVWQPLFVYYLSSATIAIGVRRGHSRFFLPKSGSAGSSLTGS